MIISVVGAGGKTTLIHQMAKNFRNQGKKVFVTTTTHMYEDPGCLIDPSVFDIIRKIEKNGYAFAGSRSGDGKIGQLPENVFCEAAKAADVVLVEADGAKHFPLKYPKDTEPCIPGNTDRIIVVLGVSSIGKRVGESVFRLEQARKNESLKELREDEFVTADLIQTLYKEGYMEPLNKSFPDLHTEFYGGKKNTLYERAVEELIRENKPADLIRKEWFFESPKLFIFGGGHVGRAVSRIGAFLGFSVTVIDDRNEFSKPEDFPRADRVICHSFSDLSKVLRDKSENAYFVIATRGHQSDYDCVSQLLNMDFVYLGMMGSRRKVEETKERLRKEGISEEKINSIHAPIGLPIKAQTPEEIAVSIMAEIIQVKNENGSMSIPDELRLCMKKGVLCIITEKSGSAPRGVGSMMLVTEEGILGTVGGGVVEAKAIEKAASVDEICEETYSLSMEEAGNIGMICGGKNKILFLPLSEIL